MIPQARCRGAGGRNSGMVLTPGGLFCPSFPDRLQKALPGYTITGFLKYPLRKNQMCLCHPAQTNLAVPLKKTLLSQPVKKRRRSNEHKQRSIEYRQ